MNKIKLEIFANEHWWGGSAALGYTMPYDCNSNCTVDQINNTTNNLVSPLLMSDCGRFLYAPNGLAYIFKDGEFPDEDLIIHPQYNTWIELTHYQCEEKIIEYAENLVKNGMPRGVIMIDATW